MKNAFCVLISKLLILKVLPSAVSASWGPRLPSWVFAGGEGVIEDSNCSPILSFFCQILGAYSLPLHTPSHALPQVIFTTVFAVLSQACTFQLHCHYLCCFSFTVLWASYLPYVSACSIEVYFLQILYSAFHFWVKHLSGCCLQF